MNILEEDEEYLSQKGYKWELLADGENGALIIKDYPVNENVFDRPKIDLLIIIPAQYNNAKLDMFYVDPPLKKKDGSYPNAAEHFEDHVGRRWQRFSRHLNSWLPGIDSLAGFMSLISKELQKNK
ncbi:MAG: E2/UBC family protein [Candidatus Moraniibacteriota bacterium]